VAEIAVVEYVEGIFKSDLAALKDAVMATESAIQKADARLERTRLARQRLHEALGKKETERSSTDIIAELDIEDRLEATELTLVREKSALERTKIKQNLLEHFTKPRTIKELKADVERKRSDELAKKATWELEVSKARKLERQIAACVIKAPADGIFSYANVPELVAGRTPQIEEGATVRERQKIFRVIDLSGPLVVNTKVRESQIDRLSPSMKAKIHVDAFANETLDGTVVEVAPLPDPTNSRSVGTKIYTTTVRIDQRLPGLRPGMSAQVEILVSEKNNVISVPVAGIVRYDGKDHVAVKKAEGAIEWREVTLGASNDRDVEVKEGLKSGEQVALKPGDLLSEQTKREMRNRPTPPAAKPRGPQGKTPHHD
jgi:HlyD family secretion protein